MSAIILFLVVIAAIVGWWLSHQRLMAKPWLEEGALGDFPGSGASSLPAAKLGLGVFLAVVGSLFTLLISAFFMRMNMPEMSIAEGAPLPAPKLLWLNTAMLIVSSVALQWAWVAARRGQMDGVRAGLLAGGVSALAFIAGQLLAWKQLAAAGYFLAGNPASAFFYLITAVHGLHVLGGLVALGRTTAKVLSPAPNAIALRRMRLSVELCAIYWHFMLLVWLVLFSLLTRWTDDFVEICRGLLT